MLTANAKYKENAMTLPTPEEIKALKEKGEKSRAEWAIRSAEIDEENRQKATEKRDKLRAMLVGTCEDRIRCGYKDASKKAFVRTGSPNWFKEDAIEYAVKYLNENKYKAEVGTESWEEQETNGEGYPTGEYYTKTENGIWIEL